MKTFLIVKNNNSILKSLDENYIVKDDNEKDKIIKHLNISINKNEYTFFDEKTKTQKYFKQYLEAIIETYFPSHWDAKKNAYLYYPEKKEIKHKNGNTTLVYNWDTKTIDENSVSYIRFVSDDSDDPDEKQKVLIIHNTYE